MMYKSLFRIGAVVAIASAVVLPASAQQELSLDSVVSTCAQVVESERVNGIADHPLRGFCVDATFAFVAAAFATVPPGEVDALFANLVVELANLNLTQECLLESEVSEAVGFVGRSVVDESQREQIQLISATIANCEIFAVAAVAAGFPASVN